MSRTNKHRQVILFSSPPNSEDLKLEPFMGGNIKFDNPKTKQELVEYVRKIADDNPELDIYFSLRKNAPIWFAYRTDQEESEFDNLIKNSL